VIQAYLNIFLIEPGYKEHIKTVEQMLKCDMKFGFVQRYERFFTDISNSIDSAIYKNAVPCPNYETCHRWVLDYRNSSTIINEITIIYRHVERTWTDENNRPLKCDLEDGCVETSGLVFLVSLGSPILELINEVIGHIIVGGINIQLRDRGLYKAKLDFKFHTSTFTDTHYAINIIHLQTEFYRLCFGYVMSVVCFVSEIIWHRYR
jgi:hypothetical protein